MGIVSNYFKNKVIRSKIEQLRLKNDLAQAKIGVNKAKNVIKKNKWQRLREDYSQMQEIAEDMAQDFEKGGIQSILDNPIAMQLIKSLIPMVLGQQQPGKQIQKTLVTPGEAPIQQNGADMSAIFQRLPKSTQKQVYDAIKAQQK